MKKAIIDISELLTYERYAELNTTDEQPLSRQRIVQLVAERRLPNISIDGKNFIHKNAKIKPSKRKPGPKPDPAKKVRHKGRLVYKSQL